MINKDKPVCVKCEFISTTLGSGNNRGTERHICKHESSGEVNVVTGRTNYKSCDDMRQTILGECGLDGKHFKEKQKTS